MIKANVRGDETFLHFPGASFLISWLFNRTAKRFSGIDFMDLVPVAKVKHELGPDEGQVTLLIPRFTGPVWGKLIQPRLGEKKRFIRLPLESRGSLLWLNMDGKAKVGDLVSVFGENFENDQQDTAERLSGYLFNMWENKFIEFSNLP